MIRRFTSSGSPWEALAGYSRAVIDGRWVFVSGTIGTDFSTGLLPDGAAEQAERAIDTIAATLAEGQATLADIVRVRVFVPEPADVAAVSEVIRRRIGPSRAANTTICSPLAVPGARVEIEVTAHRSGETQPAHTATALVRAPAALAFAFLADGLALGNWALGCFGTADQGDGLFLGHSLFDGRPLLVRIAVDPERLEVTYRLGSDPDRLVPRIGARAEPLRASEADPQACQVSMTAERTPDMTAEHWRRLITTHETEILLIKAQIERRAPQASPHR